MKLTKEQGKLLEPFAESLWRFDKHIGAKDDAELDSLLEAASLASETNCWWATYRASKIILEIATDEKSRRAGRAALAKGER